MNIAPDRAKPTARRWASMALSLTGVALVAACGSSIMTGSSGSSTPAAGSPAAGAGSSPVIPCAQITALRSSLTDLSDTSVSPTSAGRIASDLARAEMSLDALKGQATGPFAAEANQLTNALNAIKASADAVATSPTPANVANLTSAVNRFKATAQPLIKEMQTLCPHS